MQRETMEYDVVVVGAGPAGLSAAIRLKQLNSSLRVCVLEKGAEVGAHILSGCAFDPRALNTLFPDWKERGAPLETPVTEDRFLFLTSKFSARLPTPPQMRNHGCYIISLADLTRWLGKQAEALGVEIFPGFAAVDVIVEGETVKGVVTGEMGRGKDGKTKENYQPGVEIRAEHTLLAEGCRGNISEHLMRVYGMRSRSSPQTYGIGIKELWEVEPSKAVPGRVTHTVGWPLDRRTYGGSFIYHMGGNKVATGYVIGLDYENPHLDPFREFQRFKMHPAIRPLFEGGRRIAYGARALNEGGFQSVPEVVFPGGALLGCAAGLLNVPRIKGSHTAMMSGILAAEAIREGSLARYPAKLRGSWVYDELYYSRNIRPAFHHFGLYGGLLYAALDTYLYRGHARWTLTKEIPDHACMKRVEECKPIAYPKPDGKIMFDRMSSVYLSNTSHAEDQPSHLVLADPAVPVRYNLPLYDAPEQRYCPAGVYEMVGEGNHKRLQINAPNCVHCKTCDIKDPTQNILWVPPEGGGGPRYGNM